MTVRVAIFMPEGEVALNARLDILATQLTAFGVDVECRSSKNITVNGFTEAFDAVIVCDNDLNRAALLTAYDTPNKKVIRIKAGSVASITKDTAGTGYNADPTVTISGGGGSGATATVSRTGTALNVFTVTAPGKGYTSVPTVTITPVSGGTGGAATAVLDTSGLKMDNVDANVFTLTQVTDGTMARWLVIRQTAKGTVDASAVLDPMGFVLPP